MPLACPHCQSQDISVNYGRGRRKAEKQAHAAEYPYQCGNCSEYLTEDDALRGAGESHD
jgi:hypothetical protein